MILGAKVPPIASAGSPEPAGAPNPAGLLATKLYRPPLRSTLVPRPRLIAQLDDGLRRGCRLTLVSGPAGYGKTVLLAEWLARNDERRAQNAEERDARVGLSALSLQRFKTAWLSLDEEDNEPGRFWSYLIAALQGFDAGIGIEARTLLAAPHRSALHAVLSSLLNDLAARDYGAVLILDDYQLIVAPAIHEGLAYLLDHAPPQLHVVLSSRAEPPLPIVRLRARDQLAEVRGEDLRLTLDETAAFLAATTGVVWPREELLELYARTEGWAVALQIAALELRRLLAVSPTAHSWRDVCEFIRSFSGHHHDIADFLDQEVLAHQPEQIRSFLVMTSLLNRLEVGACDAMVGQAGSQAILARLDRDNLFVVPLDCERSAYRYHAMFADVLRARLERTQPARIRGLHERAAEWYERSGGLAAAMSHRLRAADIALAGGLVDRREPVLAPAVSGRADRGWRPAADGSTELKIARAARARMLVEAASRPEAPASLASRSVGDAPEQTIFLPRRLPADLELVEQLTDRELDILRLMAEGLTFAEICHRLVLGLNTVRFHAKNIYGKLAVHHRAQAVARAHALGLLP